MVITLQPFLYNLATNIVIRTIDTVSLVFITFNKFKAHSLPLKMTRDGSEDDKGRFCGSRFFCVLKVLSTSQNDDFE